MAKTPSCDCSRRQAVRSLFTGSLLFPAVLQQMLADTGDSLAPRVPHFPGKAKRVIFMYMPGGVSHVDSFDYKPKLIEAAETGKKTATGRLYTGMTTLTFGGMAERPTWLLYAVFSSQSELKVLGF